MVLRPLGKLMARAAHALNEKFQIAGDCPPHMDDEANYEPMVYHISRAYCHHPSYVKAKLDQMEGLQDNIQRLRGRDLKDLANFKLVSQWYADQHNMKRPFYVSPNLFRFTPREPEL